MTMAQAQRNGLLPSIVLANQHHPLRAYKEFTAIYGDLVGGGRHLLNHREGGI